MTGLRAVLTSSIVVAALGTSGAIATSTAGVSKSSLVDPWKLAKEFIEYLPVKFKALKQEEKKAQLDRRLKKLDVELAELARQKDELAANIAVSGFVYIVPLKSYEMSKQVAMIIATFDGMYSDLAIRQEGEAKATRAAMDKLRQTLHEKWRLEGDLKRAQASGDPAALKGLAEQWRAGAASVLDVRDAVVKVRAQLNRTSPSATQPTQQS